MTVYGAPSLLKIKLVFALNIYFFFFPPMISSILNPEINQNHKAE